MQGRRERQRIQVQAAARGQQQPYVAPVPKLLRQTGQQAGAASEVGQAQTLVFQEKPGREYKFA